MPANLISTASGLWAEQPADAALDYWLDWTLPGDTIATSTWTVSPATVPPLTIADQLREPGEKVGAVLAGGQPGTWYVVTNRITTAAGRTDAQSFMLRIAGSLPATPSGLFPFPPAAVAEIRRDNLFRLAQSHLASLSITDDELWAKLLAAEAETERALRTWIAPREIVPDHPAYDAEAAAIAAGGQRVHREPGYDWGPLMFRGDKWGLLELRQKPATRINWSRFSYPAPASGIAEIPNDWWRLDPRAGTAQLVWASNPSAMALNNLVLSALSAGRHVPFMLHLSYRAGIENARDTYPDLAMIVKRLATIAILEDLLIPQSGSISADGLSRSISLDLAKHREQAETKLAKLREAIGGIRFIVA